MKRCNNHGWSVSLRRPQTLGKASQATEALLFGERFPRGRGVCVAAGVQAVVGGELHTLDLPLLNQLQFTVKAIQRPQVASDVEEHNGQQYHHYDYG
jgi:hypothetical protein